MLLHDKHVLYSRMERHQEPSPVRSYRIDAASGQQPSAVMYGSDYPFRGHDDCSNVPHGTSTGTQEVEVKHLTPIAA